VEFHEADHTQKLENLNNLKFDGMSCQAVFHPEKTVHYTLSDAVNFDRPVRTLWYGPDMEALALVLRRLLQVVDRVYLWLDKVFCHEAHCRGVETREWYKFGLLIYLIAPTISIRVGQSRRNEYKLWCGLETACALLGQGILFISGTSSPNSELVYYGNVQTIVDLASHHGAISFHQMPKCTFLNVPSCLGICENCATCELKRSVQ
jgi:hypothetical protein